MSPLRLLLLSFVACLAFSGSIRAESDPSQPHEPGRFTRWFQSDPARRARGPNIRDPGPDLANFPDSAFTLPQLGFSIESTPLHLTGPTDLAKLNYSSELLLRFGVTDNIEARVYMGGLAVYPGGEPTKVGFLPPTFDTKLHLLERTWRRFNLALGLEAYVQTTWGSPSLVNGTQYSTSVLIDHELPWDLGLEWNLGFVSAPDPAGVRVVLPTFQAALQHDLIKDLAVFVQLYRNGATLPRTALSKSGGDPTARGTAFGVGLQWTLGQRVALFGNFNLGYGTIAPLLSGSAGLALSL